MARTGWHKITLTWARNGYTGTTSCRRKGERAISEQLETCRGWCKAKGKAIVSLTAEKE